jgi:hypothetical protein
VPRRISLRHSRFRTRSSGALNGRAIFATASPRLFEPAPEQMPGKCLGDIDGA